MNTAVASIGKSPMAFRFVDEKIPNATTLAAMEEAKRDDLETLDLDNFQEWIKSL